MLKSFGLPVLLSAIFLVTGACTSGPKVGFVQSEHRIDVFVEGRLITSYDFGDALTKPILYPLHTPSGVQVNRGFPFRKVEGESEDHPHHTGLFFTYDQVNGTGFWNNTTSPPRIEVKEILDLDGGAGVGTLSVLQHWIDREGKVLLEEKRDMAFSKQGAEIVIDFDITLRALDERVVFEDTKEGMFGIRVAHWLKEKGGTGRYLSANGDETEANVWGKRAPWMKLEGRKDGKTAGIAILNHPDSINYPTFWHARGYGLFAANPLGQYVFEKNRKEPDPKPFRLTLEPGEKARFLFRVILYDFSRTREQMEARFKAYAGLS